MCEVQVAYSNLMQVRSDVLDGRDHLVAPIVLLVEGVLNRELVLAEEFGRFVECWNDVPLPLAHPQVRGQHVSAKGLDVVIQAVGRLYNVRLVGDRLVGEAWIDVEKAQESEDGQELLRRLDEGQAIEVSTGYFRDPERVTGVWDNGRLYESIARNIRPDHVALLLWQQGACSWKDGCGMPRVNGAADVLLRARRPAYEGTETGSWADVNKSFEAFRDAYYKHTGKEKPEDVPASVAAASSGLRRWIASKSLLGHPAGVTFREVCFFPVVNPGSNKLNKGALLAVLGGRGAQADIASQALESARSMARRLLEKEFDVEVQDNEDVGILPGLDEESGMEMKVLVELSLDEQARRVYVAWQKLVGEPLPGQPTWWVQEVFADRLIARFSDGRLMAYPYTVSEAGEVVFGEPVKVEVVYQPVGNVAAEGDFPPLPPAPPVPPVPPVPPAVCAECDDDVLGSASEPVLPATVTLPVTNAEPAIPRWVEELQGLVVEFGGVPALGSMLRGIQERVRAEREERIAALVADPRVNLKREELAAMGDDVLAKLERGLRPVDYSGRGAPAERSNGGVPAPLPVVLTK